MPDKNKESLDEPVLAVATAQFGRWSSMQNGSSISGNELFLVIEGFSHFVTSMTAPIASGWSVAGDLHPLESAALHGARQEQPFDGRFLNFHGQDSFFAVTGGWP